MFNSITSRKGNDAQKAQRPRRGYYIRPAHYLILLLFACIASIVFLTPAESDKSSQIESLLNDNRKNGDAWNKRGSEYHLWIVDSVGPAGGFLFDALRSGLTNSLEVLSRVGPGHSEIAWLKRFWLGLHLGLLQLVFIVVAWWKIWIVLTLASFVWGIFHVHVHSGLDVLGQLSNGRPFFSGLRIELKKFSANGAPELQVPGLACPPTVATAVAKESNLAKILEKHAALNITNLYLTGIILRHENWPAFVGLVAPLGADRATGSINKDLQTINLLQYVEKSLEVVFGLRAQYGVMRNATAGPVQDPQLIRGNLTFDQYAELLRYSIDRALTAAQKEDLGSMPAAVVATAVLALAAGNVMAVAKVGQRWSRVSNYLNLSARAVLHSAPQLSAEYDFDTRTDIRRALVYSKRNGILTPHGFALDTSNRSMALRQVVEILMAAPHELTSVADEVELYGIISEAQRTFGNVLSDAALGGRGDCLESGLSFNKVFFLNFKEIERLLQTSIERPQLERLKKLHALISKKQHIAQMSADQLSETNRITERLSMPIVAHHQRELAEQHKLSLAAIADWSAYRLILGAGGWLARRVGDYNLPESHLCALVYQTFNSTQNGGSVAMVALRASRLNERCGDSWTSQLVPLKEVVLANDQADFKKKLSAGSKLATIDNDNVEDVQNI